MDKVAPKRIVKPQQAGLGLISAIFVITLMAVIATGISRLVISNQHSHSQQILSVKAHFAAESALQKTLAALAAGEHCELTQNTQALKVSPECRTQSHCHPAENNALTLTITASCGHDADLASHRITRVIPLENTGLQSNKD